MENEKEINGEQEREIERERERQRDKERYWARSEGFNNKVK